MPLARRWGVLAGAAILFAVGGVAGAGAARRVAAGVKAAPKRGRTAPSKPAPKPGVQAPASPPRTRVNQADGSVLVWVPGGTFRMGSTQGDPDEKPPHSVRVEGFWLGKHEVTNAQYAKFLAATEYEPPMFWEDPDLGRPQQPVVGVKWSEAFAYCEWAGGRLPTEAEWEYAAAAGARQLAYGTATGKLTHDLANYAGTGGRDRWGEATAPVGSFPPNPLGLYDLAGNAWEWCSSTWQPYPYRADDGRENLDYQYFRVMRGGCWHFGAFHCRAACRHRHYEHLQLDYVGFRLAASPIPGELAPPVKPAKAADP